MQPIQVTAHFDEEGKIRPLRFTWRGSDYQVESTGRHWDASDGRHILVMVPGGRIFELVYIPIEGRWFLGGAQTERMAA